ncbi:hypothetical protein CCAX7_009210 [Capsulimonas corticalis]|uniref:Uncharacterized protein n=2 Tax=Capsulimonas corticalis TaxID=2219043 RepID=A0A402CU69_9BACT|nr:hypothetical protein CCAX7_009210 [Capsulimonas corticalis]
MGFRHFTQTTQTLGVGWALAQVGLFLLYDIPITLIITAVIAPEKEAFSRRRHTITTSAVGIRFSDGQRAIEAAWSDILAYEEGVLGKRFVEYSRNCIKTKQGDFDFTVVIHDQRHLCRIIDHWVPDTAREKPIPGEGVIGGEGSLWTGGQIGEGERVYHYRVSATRGLLLVYALFLLAPVLSGLVNGFGDVWRDKTIRIIEPLECISFLGCAWAYFHTSVTVTDNALIQRSLLGTIVIPWQDVVSYKNEEGMRQVISRSKHIRFSAPIADLEGLQTEIERRAVNSENKGWGKISRGYQGENHVTHN